jgi:predicted Zn-dependent peptidase
MNAEADTNPLVDILWHTVPFAHKDSYALEILAQLLSERTGRLYKGIVLGAQVATDVRAMQNSQKWAGYFNITGEVKDGHTPAEVEQAIYAELDKLKRDDVPAGELQKVKNYFTADKYRALKSNFEIMIQLLFNDGLGDWHEINNANAKIQAVTAADVKRVATEYFTKENRAVATYTRKPGSVSAKEDKQ